MQYNIFDVANTEALLLMMQDYPKYGKLAFSCPNSKHISMKNKVVLAGRYCRCLVFCCSVSRGCPKSA